MCRVRPCNLLEQPQQDGTWYRNRQGYRVQTDRKHDALDRLWCYRDRIAGHWQKRNWIHLPSHWAARHATRVAKIHRGVNAPTPSPALQQIATSSRYDIISSLPEELLMQILELVLPLKRTFHFSRLAHKLEPRVSVHQVCPAGVSPCLSNLARLALVSSRFRDTVYGLFYGTAGQNRFVLELSNVPLTPCIAVDAQETEFGTWSRVCRASSSIVEPLYPLYPQTLRNIANLTLSISLSTIPTRAKVERHSTKRRRVVPSFAKLRDTMEAFGTCFGQEGHYLKHLNVALGLTTRNGSRYRTKMLTICKDGKRRHGIAIFDHDSESGSKSGKSADSLRDTWFTVGVLERGSVADFACLNDMIAPLLDIRGVREVNVGGFLNAKFEDDLRDSALQSFERGCGVQRDASEPSRKRTRRN